MRRTGILTNSLVRYIIYSTYIYNCAHSQYEELPTSTKKNIEVVWAREQELPALVVVPEYIGKYITRQGQGLSCTERVGRYLPYFPIEDNTLRDTPLHSAM